VLFPLLTLVIYTGGYMPFHFEQRYLWIVNVLLLLMGGHVINILFEKNIFNKDIARKILITIFVISFVITPLKSYMQIYKNDINKEMFNLSAALSRRYNIKGNIASNREWQYVATHSSWHKTFRLSYWLNSRYYGQARSNISDSELESELREHGIDYYFLWGETDNIPGFLTCCREITGGEMPGLKIYSLKEERQDRGIP
jgi:hypothetical protein